MTARSDWFTALEAQLQRDRALLDSPDATFTVHQREAFGLTPEQYRLPEHFRGPWEEATVCFLGPHVQLIPDEPAPTAASSVDPYVAYYREPPTSRRDPYGHYQAIMADKPYLATELVHWPCEKELALKLLKSHHGPALVDEAMALTWAVLKESAVHTLVLTGNDALKWVLPRLGYTGPSLPGVTQQHGRELGTFALPGAPTRTIRVVASFHWSKEMPLFVRKVAGLEGLPVRDAISLARQMIADACRPV